MEVFCPAKGCPDLHGLQGQLTEPPCLVSCPVESMSRALRTASHTPAVKRKEPPRCSAFRPGRWRPLVLSAVPAGEEARSALPWPGRCGGAPGTLQLREWSPGSGCAASSFPSMWRAFPEDERPGGALLKPRKLNRVGTGMESRRWPRAIRQLPQTARDRRPPECVTSSHSGAWDVD